MWCWTQTLPVLPQVTPLHPALESPPSCFDQLCLKAPLKFWLELSQWYLCPVCLLHLVLDPEVSTSLLKINLLCHWQFKVWQDPVTKISQPAYFIASIAHVGFSCGSVTWPFKALPIPSHVSITPHTCPSQSCPQFSLVRCEFWDNSSQCSQCSSVTWRKASPRVTNLERQSVSPNKSNGFFKVLFWQNLM